MEKEARLTDKGRRRHGYRDTVRLLKDYLRPVNPEPAFSRRLEELCRSMGVEDTLLREAGAGRGIARRSMLIGGAIFSALPFLGVVAYAIGRRLQRRRVVPMGA